MNELLDRQPRGLSSDAQLAIRVIRDDYGDLGHGRDLLELLKILARVTSRSPYPGLPNFRQLQKDCHDFALQAPLIPGEGAVGGM